MKDEIVITTSNANLANMSDWTSVDEWKSLIDSFDEPKVVKLPFVDDCEYELYYRRGFKYFFRNWRYETITAEFDCMQEFLKVGKTYIITEDEKSSN